MTSPYDLRRIYDEAATLKNNRLHEQLAYRHMVVLADHYEGWAMDARLDAVQSAKLLGMAESMRQLAELVGPDWNPPEPDRLTAVGFLARKMLDEIA